MPEITIDTLLAGAPEARKKIINYFGALIDYLDQMIGVGRFTILLVGSLARGEETIVDRRNLWSDIEYFIVYRNASLNRKEIEADVRAFNKAYLNLFPNVLFHIDFVALKQNKINKMRKKLIVFEARNSHVVIAGEDAAEKMPNIDIANIDYEDLNDVLLHRMFSIYANVKKVSMNRTGSQAMERYILARNSLDLLTVLLPCLGYLASGYRNRFELLKNRLEEIRKKADSIVDEEFIDFMRESLACKISPMETRLPPEYFLRMFLKYVVKIREIVSKRKRIIYPDQARIWKRCLLKIALPPRKKRHFLVLYRELNSWLRSPESSLGGELSAQRKKIVERNYLLYGYPA